MDCEPLLRHVNPSDQPRCDHPPADRALQRTKRKDQPQPPFELWLDPAAQLKKHERQQKGRPDQPPEEPVRPLPPIDPPEFVERHAFVDEFIFRGGFVFIELDLPRLLAHGRQHTRDWTPFDDGKPRVREARGTPDHHHQNEQSGNRPKPDPDRAPMRARCRGLGRGRRGFRFSRP
jgi:hypothetical protein